uniref:(California timema) hypothetical protein n=1 Tax=Timema californicum TaxID=61474 RepID=A0A7R9JH15_TIMCA|nr:unnamed protein product [Timema californicum]
MVLSIETRAIMLSVKISGRTAGSCKRDSNQRSFPLQFLRIPFTSTWVSKFIYSLIDDTMRTREREGIVRTDMIQLLMEARKEEFPDEQGSNGVNGDKRRKIDRTGRDDNTTNRNSTAQTTEQLRLRIELRLLEVAMCSNYSKELEKKREA